LLNPHWDDAVITVASADAVTISTSEFNDTYRRVK
jgi:hypothetical protein